MDAPRPPIPRQRLCFGDWPAAVYAVGDVHGCYDALAEIERQILADGAEIPGEKWIVMLGDYVDRGPRSRDVIDRLIEPLPDGFRRICLVGNHELLLLGFLEDPDLHAYWLDQGGVDTLASYGVEAHSEEAQAVPADLLAPMQRNIPSAHVEFLRTLPIMLELPGWLFVHAGVRPGVPLDRQSDEDLVWIREPFLSKGLAGYRVVHGHTPESEPQLTPYRIGIDTHCYETGRLTALRLTEDGEPRFFTAQT